MHNRPENRFIDTPGDGDGQGRTETDASLDGGDGSVHSVLQVDMPNGK